MNWSFREDEYLVNMQHTVLPSWYQREGYIKAMSNLIEKELKSFDCPKEVVYFLPYVVSTTSWKLKCQFMPKKNVLFMLRFM